MNRYPLTVFDFDGTLVDSGPGILNGLKYALEHLDLELPPGFELRPCIGPPLSWTFQTKLHVPEEKIEEAISIYRDYYGRAGAFEAELYPGIKTLLEDLNRAGAVVCLATTKYSVMAEKMMDHFGIRGLIRHAAMSTINQANSAKKEMILDILQRSGQSRGQAVMIGDTSYDASGAAAAGVDFIGVLYGYGLRGEMEQAGGRRFVADAAGLRAELFELPPNSI